ncbi:hypothetical protein [Flavobacterium proteolyticum]|uniref:Lipoprotein n=1 Tax=Flavobacterium proteolyticum TaxID=2911683 RepID=A0ABR9WTU4_9FLAO|nr:hypothetical protein [Flavobacterium proteolyticum]MBE9577071.1 hypothetical protein [Flavobacterium proteolyticum]
MKKLIIFIIIILNNSCTSVKDFSGLYGKCEKRYLACTQLLLNKNQTFEYFVFYDVGGGHIKKGNWEKLNDSVIKLNTYDQPKNPKTYYNGKILKENSDKIHIKIRDIDFPFEGMYVSINGNNGKETDENGIVIFEKTQPRFVTYSFLGIKDSIIIDNPKFNDIEIVIRDFDSPYLTDEKIIIKKNKVKIPLGNLTFREFELKKINMRKKQW